MSTKYEIRLLTPESHTAVILHSTEDLYAAIPHMREIRAYRAFKTDETVVLVDISDNVETTLQTITPGPRPMARY